MGYLEIRCQLCQVGFNIGRLRTPHEPQDQGYGWQGTYYNSSEPEPIFQTRQSCKDMSQADECPSDHLIDPTNNEHLAKQGQVIENIGYNGYNISKEEMEDIVHAICILRKGHMETDEDKDGTEPYPFEENSRCFVTGVAKYPPMEMDLSDIEPARYGVTECSINNYLSDVQDLNNPDEPESIAWGIPMHVACFDIFKLACENWYEDGEIDIDGLFHTASIVDESVVDYEGFKDVNYGPEVRGCQEQWWWHGEDTEYLAAHPFKLPTFRDRLLEALKTVGKQPTTDSTDRRAPHRSDLFSKLSQELLDQIILLLPVADLCNLRLSSRAFTNIPDTYFRNLIHEDMPYLALNDELKKKYHAESLDDMITAINASCNSEEKGVEGGTVSWYSAYASVKSLIPTIKGLKNRRRIWTAVADILRLIQRVNERASKEGNIEVSNGHHAEDAEEDAEGSGEDSGEESGEEDGEEDGDEDGEEDGDEDEEEAREEDEEDNSDQKVDGNKRENSEENE